MSPFSPVSKRSSIQSATFVSQGQRSASASGCPAAIFSMFAGGWSASPSSNGHPSRLARMAATVVLPQPDTPMRTKTLGFILVIWRLLRLFAGGDRVRTVAQALSEGLGAANEHGLMYPPHRAELGL